MTTPMVPTIPSGYVRQTTVNIGMPMQHQQHIDILSPMASAPRTHPLPLTVLNEGASVNHIPVEIVNPNNNGTARISRVLKYLGSSSIALGIITILTAICFLYFRKVTWEKLMGQFFSGILMTALGVMCVASGANVDYYCQNIIVTRTLAYVATIVQIINIIITSVKFEQMELEFFCFLIVFSGVKAVLSFVIIRFSNRNDASPSCTHNATRDNLRSPDTERTALLNNA